MEIWILFGFLNVVVISKFRILLSISYSNIMTTIYIFSNFTFVLLTSCRLSFHWSIRRAQPGTVLLSVEVFVVGMSLESSLSLSMLLFSQLYTEFHSNYCKLSQLFMFPRPRSLFFSKFAINRRKFFRYCRFSV